MPSLALPVIEPNDNPPPGVVSLLGEGRVPYIRSSPISTLKECKRKFLYVYRWGIRPKALESALELGTVVHTVLQELFLGRTREEATARARSQVDAQSARLTEWGDKAGFLPNGKSVKEAQRTLLEDFHKGTAMALCFWEYEPFSPEKWEVATDHEGQPLIERVLEADLPELGLTARTPCDLVLRNKENGELWIVDFKTTSYDTQTRVASTRFSPQLRLYRAVLHAHHLSPAGSIHAILKKPTIKYCPNTKDKAGFSSYLERVVEWYGEQQTENPQTPPLVLDFNRFQGPVIPLEFASTLKEYAEYAKMDPYENLYRFPRAGDYTCMAFNRTCPYLPLCNSSPVMWPGIVRDYFQVSFREDEEDSARD